MVLMRGEIFFLEIGHMGYQKIVVYADFKNSNLPE
jgi:hypothetical protein